jgi:ABC-type bacteriocin/lantibiotic exporter with double-glycine peptidase domain
MDFQLALVAFAPLLPIVLITLWTQEALKKSFQQTELSQVQFRSKLHEGVNQLESLSVARAKGSFEQLVWQLYETQVVPNQSRPLMWRAYLADFQGFLLALGGLGVLYLGAHKVVEDHLSFGIYLAINMFSRQLVGTFQRLGDGFAQWLSLSAKLEQATEDANQLTQANANQTTSRLNLTLPNVQGFLEAKGIHFSYLPDMPPTLKQLSLSVPAGAKLALVGRSGSGKSTLLRLFHGALQPQAGQLSLDGYALPDLALDFLHESVGMVHAQQGIFQGTLKENITLFDDTFSPKAVLDAASLSGLADMMQSPHGLNLPIMSNGGNLSEGQTARILLARAVLRNPAVLLIDDIFSGLEPPVIDAILQQLLIRFRQQTVVVVSHSPQVHRFFDAVMVLESGQCVETGTVDELLAQRHYYYHLYGSGS